MWLHVIVQLRLWIESRVHHDVDAMLRYLNKTLLFSDSAALQVHTCCQRRRTPLSRLRPRAGGGEFRGPARPGLRLALMLLR